MTTTKVNDKVVNKKVRKTVKPTVKKPVVKKDVKKEVKKESKMSKAVVIMEEMFPLFCEGTIERKDIIKRLMKDAGLTLAGSATYYQNIKAKILKDEL